jgi:multidrug efflux pump subunit AcrB
MGVAGRIARSFLRSKLTPLITIASLAVGVIGILATPREEEPQITVPMIDVLTGMPGAGPEEVENIVTRAVERRMWEIPGVDHVYSTSGEGWSLVTVRFRVGEDQERSVTRVHAKLLAELADVPPGVTTPLVKPHSIDDVPVYTLTLSSDRYDANALRAMAVHLEDEVRTIGDVAATWVTGGSPRRIRVELDPRRLGGREVTASEVLGALQGAGSRVQAGEFPEAGRVVRVDAGAPLETAGDVGLVVVGVRGGAPVLLRDVATVREEFGEPLDYVMHAEGEGEGEGASRQAVTLSIAKRPGANASTVTRHVEERVEEARSRLLPDEVHLSVTRDYGETAAEKARELIRHLLLAKLSVKLVLGIFLGCRVEVVVFV